MRKFKYITSNPQVERGKPFFRGTEVFVSEVLKMLGAGKKIKEILREYPQLNEDMLREAILYAAMMVEE